MLVLKVNTDTLFLNSRTELPTRDAIGKVDVVILDIFRGYVTSNSRSSSYVCEFKCESLPLRQ